MEKLICAAVIAALWVYGYAALRSIVDTAEDIRDTYNEQTETEDDQ